MAETKAARYSYTIKADGTIVTEVLDRGGHVCSSVRAITNSLGKQLSDEETGPECPDTVHERTT